MKWDCVSSMAVLLVLSLAGNSLCETGIQQREKPFMYSLVYTANAGHTPNSAAPKLNPNIVSAKSVAADFGTKSPKSLAVLKNVGNRASLEGVIASLVEVGYVGIGGWNHRVEMKDRTFRQDSYRLGLIDTGVLIERNQDNHDVGSRAIRVRYILDIRSGELTYEVAVGKGR